MTENDPARRVWPSRHPCKPTPVSPSLHALAGTREPPQPWAQAKRRTSVRQHRRFGRPRSMRRAWGSRCAGAASALAVLLVVAVRGASGYSTKGCAYGAEPGVWEGDEFQSLNWRCPLVRYVDHVKGKPAQRDVRGEILFVGDSLNRNLVMDSAQQLGTAAEDYTPFANDDRGRPEKIGRNAVFTLGGLTVANLFHFGANERENHWLGVARAGNPGMHNTTYGRICLDGPRYLAKTPLGDKDPYMVVINSNYWDAMHWSYTTVGPPPKKDRSKNRPHGPPTSVRSSSGRASRSVTATMSGSGARIRVSPLSRRGLKAMPAEGEPAWEGQVVEPSLDESLATLLPRFVEDIRDLVDVVRRCYPGTELFCWHTAPLVATDSRNPHWFDKRPNVVAALNAAGRFVAKEKGLCLLDWDLMFQGRSNDAEWVPDGLHPSPKVSREFLNLAINAMMHHKGMHHGLLGTEKELIMEELMMP
eukprot:jgi/Tetstr1/431646/TSEL_021176.t1